MIKKKANSAIVLITIMLAAVVASCSNSGCIGNGSSIPLAAFYDYATGKQGSVSGITVKGVGAPGDSLLADSTTLSQVYLPLQVSTNSTRFVFDFNLEGLPPDTLTLRYEAVPYFHSEECGAMYIFNISDYQVTHNFIDSIAIPNKVINNEDRISIKLFI